MAEDTSRYRQVTRLIDWVQPGTIVEIGTWNGGRALEMAARALKHRTHVHYWGFDLFESADARTDAEELNVKPHHALAEVDALLARFREKHLGFSYRLIPGNTRDTLRDLDSYAWTHPETGEMHLPTNADFAYVDGGHSVETIAGDHDALKDCATVLFDDYYIPDEQGRCPDLAEMGCNALIETLPHLVLPARDPIRDGGLTQMALTGEALTQSAPPIAARKTALVTSFNAAGYEEYGKRFLESFSEFFPVSLSLRVYAEDVEVDCDDPRVEVVDLLDACPALAAFKARHADNPRAHGQLVDGDDSYRWDAVRFAHKTFAVTHAAQTLDAELMYWIDADTVAFRPVPAGLFEALLPKGMYTSYLGRPHAYPECGLVGYALDHPVNAEFMDFWQRLYMDDVVFELPEWHDSVVYDIVRRTFETKDKFTSDDMAAEAPASDHPFINSLVGLFMDHLKGGVRKARGKSLEEDLVGERSDPYWAVE